MELHLTQRCVDLVRGRVEHPDGSEVNLTTKERDVLAYLAARPGQVVEREDLLEEVWGYARSTVTRAVDHTVRRLRAKIEVDPSEPRHVLTEHGAGYRFVAGAEGSPEEDARGPALLGRQRELAALAGLVHEHRVVSIVGPGGVGKTRLMTAWLPGEAHLVDLVAARTADDVVAAAAGVLGVSSERLQAALAARPRVLALDNLEQLGVQVAALLEAWLAAAPELRLVMTSRRRLGLPGEVVLSLGGLGREDAVLLFARRAARVGAQHLDDPAVKDIIGRLAERLDGLPLALELAAARAGVLGPADLLERLHDRFSMLTGGDGPPRHQALSATIAWSWDLLAPADRTALVRLSVAAGGFELDAAEALLGPGALDVVQRLRDRSVLTTRRAGTGRLRLRPFESVREYALKRAPGWAASAEASLRDWLIDKAPEWGRSDWARLLREREALIAAHARSVQAADVRGTRVLAAALERIFAAQGPLRAWQQMVEQTLSVDPSALACRGRLLLAQGEADQAAEVLQRAVQTDESAWYDLARARRGQRRFEPARDAAQRALKGLEPGEPAVAEVQHQLGLIAYDAGDWDDAEAHFVRARTAFIAQGRELAAARVQVHLGHLALESARLAAAEGHYLQAATCFADQGHARAEGIALSHLALAAQEAGDLAGATSWLQRAEVLHREVGNQRFSAFCRLVRCSVACTGQDWAAASSHAATARRELAMLGDRRFSAVATARLAVAEAWQGRVERGRRLLEEARAELADDPGLAAGVHDLGALVALAAGDEASARARLSSPVPRSNFARVARQQLERALG